MKNKIIVVAPHADDEIIGCGGTIAKAISQGDEVYIVIATNANLGAPELFNEEAIAKVRGEALKAHEYLGVTKTFLHFTSVLDSIGLQLIQSFPLLWMLL